MKLQITVAMTILAPWAAFSESQFRLHSGPEQVTLLELYSSEGCSSCPPAEAWLNRLKDSPTLWQEVVPVDFHVDYWNYLGWNDPWSGAEFSLRQRDYAAQWNAVNVYTPEFVVNGREWQNWFGWRGAPGHSGYRVGELTVTTTNQVNWDVQFSPASPLSGPFQVHATFLAGGIHTTVQRGENAGRVLAHEFVAQDLASAGLRRDGSVARGKFRLSVPSRLEVSRWAIAVWVTQGYTPTPVQAVGGWLPTVAH